jgi:hypothetical protein
MVTVLSILTLESCFVAAGKAKDAEIADNAAKESRLLMDGTSPDGNMASPGVHGMKSNDLANLP